MSPLLDDNTLERSEVVANAAMNRERGLEGVNSYARDLGFNPLDALLSRLQTREEATWLDLCCGAGKALIQGAERLHEQGLGGRVRLVGVDLVPMFYSYPSAWSHLSLLEASLSSWQPEDRFDLITCVHGLHYLGDKLGLLQRAASWLRPGGLFVGHLDLANIRLGGTDGPRILLKPLREAGFDYDRRRHIVSRVGGQAASFLVRYLGADDTAGPNFSGQPAVLSHYEPRFDP
jgi:SAM-dependent methyltransferase